MAQQLSSGQRTCDHCNVVLPSTNTGGLCKRCGPNAPGDAADPGFTCESCGYDLIGLIIGKRCPECGNRIGLTRAMGRASLSREADEALGFGLVAAAMLLAGVLMTWCAWLFIPVAALLSLARARAVRLGRGPGPLPPRLARATFGTFLARGSLVVAPLYILLLVLF